MKLTVIGCGYLGATHAACMAELGHDVLGVDVDTEKVARLQAGDVPFFEPGLADVLRRNLAAGRLRFTSDHRDAASFAAVHFLGVGTPQQRGGYGVDLRHVEAAVDALIPLLRGDHLLIGKSTVPVGTAAALAQRAAVIAAPGSHIELAWSPEFLREGFAVEDTLSPDRLVLGTDPDGDSGWADEVVVEIYRDILQAGTPFIRTDWATAELVKVSANAFLATKISFINAISEICEVVDADISTLADAIGYDQRIGRRFLNAGLGFGGGCLPKDIRGFMARADEIGASQALRFLREVDSINTRRRTAMVDLVADAVGGDVLGTNIAVLGAAFKPESDDVRDSPALNVAGQLALRGASVSVFDPKAAANSQRMYPMLTYAESAASACEDADAVVVATEWAEFVHMAPDELAAVRNKVIVDGRRCLDPSTWHDAGWRYHSIGGPMRAARSQRAPIPARTSASPQVAEAVAPPAR
ncbi:UDP-glucose/GDP-mannose dehydrogenase family protein [Gordonia sp. CPCC 206044]|uniref:UDP-glucose dehydrogenase family protein n=1 Tax=Gordonia sp. CPCC 206044 TaxID=3140793 RepID=UPI003AF3A97C